MHIELTELLRCPEPHAPGHLVLSTGSMLGRTLRSGTVGCPVCRREYPIQDGIVEFGVVAGGAQGGPAVGERRGAERGAVDEPFRADAATLQALLDLGGPGGIVVLVGRAVERAEGLAALMGGIHFVGVNPSPDLEPSPVLTLLRAPSLIPLRDAVARGVVVGRAHARSPWLAEAVRVLLRGRRLVVEGQELDEPGVNRLAVGEGLWVGEKR